jgi:hypothetical protein
MSGIVTQLSIFDEKIAVDKNLSFHTSIVNGELTFSYDYAESFDEPAAVINDVLLFIMKQYYDDPIRGAVFTIKDYATFTGRSLTELRKKIEEGGKHGNELERLLYKLVNRNLILHKDYILKNREDKIQEIKGFALIGSFEILTKKSQPNITDKRVKFYKVLPHQNIRLNMPSFLYYVSTKDYNLLSSKYYRNPSYRVLYMRLCSLYNSLKIGRQETITFDELAKILDYNINEPRKAKQLISKTLTKLLSMESLFSLGFDWTTSDNGKYKYKPWFYLKDEKKTLLAEKTIDKFKRLDMLIIESLREYIPFDIITNSFEYDTFISILKAENVNMYKIFDRCYMSNFKKEIPEGVFRLWAQDFIYKDDFDNIYGSSLLRYCCKTGNKMAKDTKYLKVKMLYNI